MDFYIYFNIKQLLNLHGLGIFCEATISHKISDTYLCFSIVPFTTSEMELEFFTWSGMKELSHELPNNLRLRILGNKETLGKYISWAQA